MFLVDTSVVSFFVRNNPLKERYRAEMESSAPLFVSVQTTAEIMVGADRDNWGEPRCSALRKFIEKQFTIIPITAETIPFYVSAINDSARAGRALKIADAWIVATAKEHELVLVTHDGDMLVGEQLGVRIVPLQSQRNSLWKQSPLIDLGLFYRESGGRRDRQYLPTRGNADRGCDATRRELWMTSMMLSV